MDLTAPRQHQQPRVAPRVSPRGIRPTLQRLSQARHLHTAQHLLFEHGAERDGMTSRHEPNASERPSQVVMAVELKRRYASSLP